MLSVVLMTIADLGSVVVVVVADEDVVDLLVPTMKMMKQT